MDTASRLLMFLDVVEQGSFIKAAEMRNIDRSVISRQVGKLESDLQVRLLNRTTRSFSLTSAGAEMVERATKLRIFLKETVEIAQDYHSEPRGLLRIASAPLVGRRYLQPVIDNFQKSYPDIEVELLLDSHVADIISGSFDIAFRIGEPKDSSLIARKIARNRVIVAASPDFIERYGEPKDLKELSALPAATFASGTNRIHSLSYYNKEGELCEQELKSVYRANDGEVLVMKAVSGNAYFVGPTFILDNEIATGQLIPLLPDIKLKEHSAMYAVYPHRGLPIKTQLFFDAVRDYIGENTPIWEENIPNFDNMY